MVQKAVELNQTVCVVGLGYVGLPLALAFGRSSLPTYGFDVKKKRVAELQKGVDSTGELSVEEVRSSQVVFTDEEADIAKATFIIVAVPTPVDAANRPDLSLLSKASETVGRNLKKGTTVVFESTVYPGATEELCAPILERVSDLRRGQDFKIGYSPERINPGDKEHTLEKIVKVVSGEDEESAALIEQVYSTVCLAGTHRAANIKTAEAAKVIENTQRDLNIALMNELSLIFHRIGIDTYDVLAAAGTKWNFLKFTPGLVGGHCIGVDPYYLVHKAEELGYHPEVIAAGRRVNDYMPEFVAMETIKGLVEAGVNISGARVLVMGLTFKENVTDLRNSKIADTIRTLGEFGVEVSAYDPLVKDAEEARAEFGVPLCPELTGEYDAVILATPHAAFEGVEKHVLSLLPGEKKVVVDIRHRLVSLRERPGVIYKSL